MTREKNMLRIVFQIPEFYLIRYLMLVRVWTDIQVLVPYPVFKWSIGALLACMCQHCGGSSLFTRCSFTRTVLNASRATLWRLTLWFLASKSMLAKLNLFFPCALYYIVWLQSRPSERSSNSLFPVCLASFLPHSLKTKVKQVARFPALVAHR